MAAVGTADAFQRLLEALRREGIPCILIGMSAAIAQGVMGSTLDIDLWVDLPPRQSMRVQNAALARISHRLSSRGGAKARLARRPKPFRTGLYGNILSGEEREANAARRACSQPQQKGGEKSGLASGATWGANTVVFLDDGTPVNFVYEVTGLGTFRSELRHTHPMHLRGVEVPVLDLSRIRKSKQAIRRTKDLLHLELIAEFLRCRRGLSAD